MSALKPSFVSSADAASAFPLNNLPYGVLKHSSLPSSEAHVCVAIGDYALDLKLLAEHVPSVFRGPQLPASEALAVFGTPSLNAFLSCGRSCWREVRAALQDALSLTPMHCTALRDDDALSSRVLFPLSDITLLLPVEIGDYTDFYSCKRHAMNVGTMFRGPDNALMPNWVHMPVAYHGRASSVVVSGTDIRRPCGQLKSDADEGPRFGPCRLLDFELEVATIIGGKGNALGQRISVDEAEEYIFGLALMNDWSARDIQKWEYVPLGPFGAKNFGTTMSPWIVPMEALEPFSISAKEQKPPPLEYLQGSSHKSYNISLSVNISEKGSPKPHTVCRCNFSDVYWTVSQQVAHHTVTGCNLRAGDVLASGTISGEDRTYSLRLWFAC